MDEHDLELPPYTDVISSTSPRDPVTHTVSLLDKRGKAFATLNVVSRSPSAEHAPIVREGEPVVGSLDLKFEEETALKSTTVSVVGDLVVGMNLRFTFAEVSQQLWSSAGQGDRSRKTISGMLHGHPDAKLKGNFQWPFSLQLPSIVDLPEEKGGAVKAYHLPQTFVLPTFATYVIYRVEVNINYAGLLHTNETLYTNVTYLPRLQPPVPSPTRQLAYKNRTDLVGPSGDPEGWHTLEPVTIQGVASGEKRVEVTYTLSLAKPLSYTRGSVIPLHLSVNCADPSVLNILSSPQAPVVDLLTTQSIGYDIWPETNVEPTQVMQRKVYLTDVKDVPSYRHMTLSFATAVWWNAATSEQVSSDARELQGEIHLSATLQPTIRLARFNYFYRVALYPPSSTDFKSEARGKLATVPVEICTYFADGPRPIAYSPPTYKKAEGRDAESATQFNPMLVPFY